MKKLIALLILTGLFCSCYKPREPKFEMDVFTIDSGWDIVSLTVHASVYNDEIGEYETVVRYNYKNLGHLTFFADKSGIYTYEGKDYNFDWNLSSETNLNMRFDHLVITDYSSPFVFYAVFGSDFTNPRDPEEFPYNINYSMSRLSKNSISCTSGDSEFVISKVL